MTNGQDAPAPGGEHPGRGERRRSMRIPVCVGFRCSVRDDAEGFFYTTTLRDFSEGGVCITWGLCRECTGYEEGGIHPSCLFAPYAYHGEGTRDLLFHIEIDNIDRDITFSGKAVYTLKEPEGERVGIAFTEVSRWMLEFMKRVIVR